MNTPFYLNPDILGRRHFSKYDLIAIIILLAFTLWVGLIFSAAVGADNSTPLRTGAAFSYAGLIIGIYMHFAKQTKKGDEFSQKNYHPIACQGGVNYSVSRIFYDHI